jgi:hypothetical protein
VSTPGGIVEWTASDGRKGKLMGPGKARTEDNGSKKAVSEKDGNAGTVAAAVATVAAGAEAADDNNPHGFTAEQDKQVVDWKSKNVGKPWALCAEEVGKSGDQCKERFKQLNAKNGNQGGGNDQGGKTEGGDTQQDSSQKKLTNRERKAANKEYKQGKGQNQNQDRRQGDKNEQASKNEQTSGNDWNTSLDNTTGNNDDGGMLGILNIGGFGDDDKKDNKDNNNDTAGAWANEGTTNNNPITSWGAEVPGAATTSWDKTNDSGSKKKAESNKDASGWSGAVNDSTDNASGDAAANLWGMKSKSGNASNTGADAWGGAATETKGNPSGGGAFGSWDDLANNSSGNTAGDTAADPWGAPNDKDGNNKDAEKSAWDTGGGGADTGAWGEPAIQKPASNSGDNGGWNATAGDGGGNATAGDEAWNKASGAGGWDEKSKDGGEKGTTGVGSWDKKSNNGDGKSAAGGGGWNDTGGDGANDATTSPWDTNQNDTGGNNSGGFDNSWGAPAKSASKAASKAPTHRQNSHHEHQSAHHKSTDDHQSTNTRPLELEVKPDDTFSADDLRLFARILQQDYQTVWNRVSWRFKDKTGRNIAPDVFEKKITGRVEGKGSERGGKRK